MKVDAMLTIQPRKMEMNRSPIALFPSAASLFALLAILLGQNCAAQQTSKILPGTQPLTETDPLDEVMVRGIDQFALQAIDEARRQRGKNWRLDTSSLENYLLSVEPNRALLAELIGAVDQRVTPRGIELIATPEIPAMILDTKAYQIYRVRWPVLPGVHAEGLWMRPQFSATACVVAIPDADWTPEMIAGLADCDSYFAGELARLGCEVLIPTLVNRDTTFSGNADIGRKVNLTHREFIYRPAFELGRHIIGLEVQKVLAAVDQFKLRQPELPIVVAGVGEGGLLAMHSAAIDDRIDHALVSGYFDERENAWLEPIYRNVWRMLETFGDAEIAAMVAPRKLIIELNARIPETDGPTPDGRVVAAPGSIVSPPLASSNREFLRAKAILEQRAIPNGIPLAQTLSSLTANAAGVPLGRDNLRKALTSILDADLADATQVPTPATLRVRADQDREFDVEARQRRQVEELIGYTQSLLRNSHRAREKRFGALDRSSTENFVAAAADQRDKIHHELFGALPKPTIQPNPRTRLSVETDYNRGYDVVLDVYPNVIASGLLLVPKNLKAGERRPVVVCQHGLEGTPQDTISAPDSKGYRAYKGFAAELSKRGFIVYAPQNPYRGGDRFRTLQRKSNLVGRSLFSYIIPQHLVTLRWLASLDFVDESRIGFYGLSYGGKTAVRVPPMLPPTEDEPGYSLSICSADFNEWVAKNASTEAPFSYVWTPEYEIFEWNMAHVANYAELSMLMTPRPFMVERGHDDGVGIDEWVAWEYAKVRRHYNKLGIGDRTQIEFFDGPHTIHGQGTYDFLHKHLRWPRPSEKSSR